MARVMEDPPEPPRRRELLLALRQAERLLRGLGSDLRLLPGPQRLELLRHANLLLDLLERSAPPARRRRSG